MAARKPTVARVVKARDGCVVDTEPLAEVLAGFVDNWNRQRGRPDRQVRTGVPGNRAPDPDDNVVTLGALVWLSTETRVPVKTIQNIARVENGRPSPRSRFTELRIADAIVTAIDQTHLLYDGTLTIKPNPLAPPAARAGCCSVDL